GPRGWAMRELCRDLAAKHPRERDEPAVQLAEQLLVDAWLVVEALTEAGRDQLAEMPVSVSIRREEDQVVVAARLVVVDPPRLLVPALWRDVHLAADDRLD